MPSSPRRALVTAAAALALGAATLHAPAVAAPPTAPPPARARHLHRVGLRRPQPRRHVRRDAARRGSRRPRPRAGDADRHPQLHRPVREHAHRPRVRRGDLDLAAGGHVVRARRAGRVVERAHARRLLDRDVGAGRGRRRHHVEVVRPGPLGRRRHDVPPDLGRGPARRPRDRLRRHPGGPQRAHVRQLPDQGRAAPARRQHGHAERGHGRRDGLARPRQHRPAGRAADDHDRDEGARRADVLPGAAHRRLRAVGRRRRGLVLADLDVDGRRLLAARPERGRLRLGDRRPPGAHRPAGRLRGPAHLRLRVRRSGQLAVQHRVRRHGSGSRASSPGCGT